MTQAVNESEIFEEIRSQIEALLKKNHRPMDMKAITFDTDVNDIGLDSLDIIGFRFNLDQTFNIEISDDDYEEHNLVKLGNLVRYIRTHIAEECV